MVKDYIGSTVLVTGGGSGIGAGLASAFHAGGAKVIIVGRSRERLEVIAARHKGMEIDVVDVANADQVMALAERIALRHPSLDTVVNNAGIQSQFDFASAGPIDNVLLCREIDVNFKGLLHVTNAFLPLLKRQKKGRMIHIGSALGYVPLASVPVYSATKAAVHNFTIALRQQLAQSTVEIIEIIPPVVETELHRDQERRPSSAMALDVFVTAAMKQLDAGKHEIPVGLAKVLRIGSRIAPGMFLGLLNKPRP